MALLGIVLVTSLLSAAHIKMNHYSMDSWSSVVSSLKKVWIIDQ